jgi:uncharacterized protein
VKILQISLFSLFITQFIKIFTVFPPDISKIISSGGMPSSHASFVTCLSTQIGLKCGFSSDLFAIVTVFSLIIIYDAGGVRRAVGEQANVLNRLIKHLDLKQIAYEKEIIKKDLKELIGHTPFEVLVGSMLGISIAIISSIIN